MKGSEARSKLGMSGSARSSARSHQGSTRSKLGVGYDHDRASLQYIDFRIGATFFYDFSNLDGMRLSLI